MLVVEKDQSLTLTDPLFGLEPDGLDLARNSRMQGR